MKTAFIGYYRINLYKPLPGVVASLHAGNRTQDPAHIRLLAAEFERDQILNCQESTVLHVVARSGLFNAEAAVPSLTGITIIDLPSFEPTERGLRTLEAGDLSIKFSGGQHRHGAVVHYLDGVVKTIRGLHQRIEKITKRKKVSEAQRTDREALLLDVSKKQAILDTGKYWAICAWDLGTFGTHISRLQ